MGFFEDLENFHPTGNKSDIIQGIKLIAAAGGAVVSIATVAIWVSSTVFPFMASIGAPVTTAMLAQGAYALKDSWSTLSTKDKDHILEAIKWLSRIIRIF